MAHLYIHIGLHRTGTTACQQSWHNAETALIANGLVYPSSFRHIDGGHHELPARVRSGADICFREIYEEMVAKGADHSLISSEEFYQCEPNKIIDSARQYFRNVSIVVTLRDPTTWAASLWLKLIEKGNTRLSFYQWLTSEFLQKDGLDGLLPPFARIDIRLSEWERLVGNESVNLVNYDNVSSLPIAVLSKISDRFRDVPINILEVNQSISVRQALLIHWLIDKLHTIGPDLDKFEVRRIAEIFVRTINTDPLLRIIHNQCEAQESVEQLKEYFQPIVENINRRFEFNLGLCKDESRIRQLCGTIALSDSENYCLNLVLKQHVSFVDCPRDFDEKRYFELNPDVKCAGVDANVHYMRWGAFESRKYK